MRGRGQYVGDLRLPGMQDVAFVRSPLAHARIRAIHVPDAARGRVFTAADLDGVLPIRAVSGLPGFKVSEQPVLATGKVRQVGELVAMCVAPTRAEAEDIAAAVVLDLEELPAVHDMRAAREPGSALVHEHWGDNVFLETLRRRGHRACLRRADHGQPHHLAPAGNAWRRSRGAATVVQLDHRLDQLVVHTATQMPHIVRNGLVGMPRRRAGPHPHRLARCRRRLRLQGDPAGRGGLRSPGWPCAAAIRCAGSRTGAST